MELLGVDDEPQARAHGRAAAKEIFRPMKWKRIGSRPDEDAKLYESAGSSKRARAGSYCLRAVRPLQGTLAEVEAVLTASTAALSQSSSSNRGPPPSLLARLLPSTLVSGGRAMAFAPLEHATGEREHVSVQFARLRPYASTTDAPTEIETHVLLAYTLTTRLQRSSAKTSDSDATASSSSVPSLLHLYRPVFSREVAQSRGPEFERARLSRNDFTVTYIAQEGSEPGTLTLEVLATCSQDGEDTDVRRRQRQRLRHDALCLTRLQPFINAYRLEQERAVLRQQQRLHYQQQQQQQQQQQRDDSIRASTRSSRMFSRGSQQQPSGEQSAHPMNAAPTLCAICTRKFGAFRWKHHCEVCDLPVCNHCLSVIASPLVTRRKRRVCSRCLYGATNGTHGVMPPQQQPQQTVDATHAVTSTAKTSAAPAPAASGSNDRPFSSLDNLVKPVEQRRYTTTTANNSNMNSVNGGEDRFDGDSQWRHQRQTRGQSAPAQVVGPSQNRTARSSSAARRPPPPPPVPTLNAANNPARRRSSRQRPQSQQFQRQTIASMGRIGVSGSVDDWHVRARGKEDQGHGAADDKQYYYSDDELLTTSQQRLRARRAQTVTIDDGGLPKPLLVRKKSFGAAVANAFASNQRATIAGTSGNCGSKKLQFVQLKTPEPDYELDFNWVNMFPKAPVNVAGDNERERARFVETQLKVDAQSVVFLRDDRELEQLAHRVLDIATQWSGCSINYVGAREVFCLVNASAQDVVEVEIDSADLTNSAIVIPDVLPREESASSFAVHHGALFFVAELENDARLRGHPLATDHGAVSFLSFPVYASSTMSASSGAQNYIIGTLDLWKLDRVAASSHVSNEWVEGMDALLHAVGVRIEDLAHESHAFLRTRQRKAVSVGSSCDSRGSTRMADSFDLFDIDSESVVESPPLTDAETLERLTRLSYAKVRGVGSNYANMMGGGASGPPSSSWKYDDSDNESTTSSQSHRSDSSRQSSSSRYSSQRYSTAAELHSTIESLLHQVSETSKLIRQTGVAV